MSEDKTLDFHFIEGNDWRKENPHVDDKVCAIIWEYKQTKDIERLIDEMERVMTVCRVLRKAGAISSTAQANYKRVYDAVLNQYAYGTPNPYKGGKQ